VFCSSLSRKSQHPLRPGVVQTLLPVAAVTFEKIQLPTGKGLQSIRSLGTRGRFDVSIPAVRRICPATRRWAVRVFGQNALAGQSLTETYSVRLTSADLLPVGGVRVI